MTEETQKGKIILITGGSRSGKSRMALRLCEERPKIFIATARAADKEMQRRIARHQSERGEEWITVEEPVEVASALQKHPHGTAVVDCLTLWLSNLLFMKLGGDEIKRKADELLTAAELRKGSTVFVTNEVGSGIVPDNALGREFRDLAGKMNQTFAAAANVVALMICGLPLWLKKKGDFDGFSND